MKHGLQTLKIVLFAVMTVLLVGLALLQVLPKSTSVLREKEEISVSSALIHAASGTYSTQITGRISNPTDRTVSVSSVTVCIGNGSIEKEIVLEGFALPAYGEKTLSFTEEGTVCWDRVSSVRITSEDNTELLLTSDAESSFGVAFLLLAAGTAVAAFLLVHAVAVRVYMAQEDAMRHCKTDRDP